MKKALFTIILSTCILGYAKAQERGKKLNKPNIPQKETKSKDKSQNKNSKQDDEFSFEEEPKLRFINEFEASKANKGTNVKIEPIKELNAAVHEDTSTIDEGEIQIVEIEEDAQFAGSEDMVKVASYFSVWNTDIIDPYGIDAKDYEEVIPIQLYDISQNRYWAGPMAKGVTNSQFGWRWRRWHTGIDLDLDTGEPIYSAFDGIVRVSGVHGGYGRCVVVRHYNGLETLYGHLSKINFESGTLVKAGDEIGKGGSTGRSSGPHLHFETRYEGNPFDPKNIFTFAPEKIDIISQEFTMTSRVYDYLRGGTSKGDFEFDEPQAITRKAWIRVRSGDTLSEIAERNHTTVANLARMNRIKTTTRLRPGYRLRIK
ncbi:peptidoglycan DD-metalloendopeptidase family protein [Emticicia sp. 17c]|uniref:peptidoglycan DD-metalloendopeptidase family protein n=1 Tax=Emticicia sp. 17c TaxID=3127704 RepID=UPI00301CEA35